jgi:hypothetical protein
LHWKVGVAWLIGFLDVGFQKRSHAGSPKWPNPRVSRTNKPFAAAGR